jgi:hypothetical protein
MWISTKNKLKIIDQKNRAVFRRTCFFSNVMQHAIGSLSDSKLEEELQETKELQEMKELQETEEELQEAEELQEMKGHKNKNENKDDQGNKKDGQKEKDQGDQKIEKKDQVDVTCYFLSSPIPQRFSFLPSEQGAYAEPILEHVERSLFRFLVKHEKYVPCKVVKDFVSKCNPPKQVDFPMRIYYAYLTL